MTTFIKAKLKTSGDKTNYGKCRVAANITEYQIKSKLFSLRIIIQKFRNISCVCVCSHSFLVFRPK